MNTTTTFVVTAPFEAARHIPALANGHPLHALHGHSFMASVHCTPPSEFPSYPGGELDSIRAHLASPVARLNYALLNAHLDAPSDENIAHWLHSQCQIPGTQAVALQSTTDTGVRVDNTGRTQVWRRYYFQAAHQLPNVAPDHKCGTMHGHGFAVMLHASYASDAATEGTFYDLLNTAWNTVYSQLDHACLNTIEGLGNPTSEHISRWIWKHVQPVLPELTQVTVFETASCGANYDGTHFQIWKEFTFDSAARFQHAPPDNPRHQLHGYTYTLRLHLSAPLDPIAGWAIDFGEVKRLFAPVFKSIDHQPLYQIADLSDCDSAKLAHWIWQQARQKLPQIFRLDLFETRGCGVVISAGHQGTHLPV